jgi:ABC-type branched-subunit amino acid transport system substrate-binding protein
MRSIARKYVLAVCVGLGAFLVVVARAKGQAVPGVTDKEVVIGSCAALEGPSSFLGRETVIGAETYIEMVNEQGGVHGRKLRLVSADLVTIPRRPKPAGTN